MEMVETQETATQTHTQEQAEPTNLRPGEKILTLVHFTSTVNPDGNYVLNAVFVDEAQKQYEFSQLQSPEWHKKNIEDFASADKKFICLLNPRINITQFCPAKKKVTQPEIASNMN